MNQTLIVTKHDESPKVNIKKYTNKTVKIEINTRLFDSIILIVPDEVWKDIKAIAKADDEGFKI